MSVHTAKSPSVSFFRSYLEQRSQRVSVNGEYSSKGIAHCGVPQGSESSFFVNLSIISPPPPPPPPPHVSSDIVNCAMFADDTTLDTSDTDPVSVENELETGINTLYLTGAAKRLRYYTI